MKVRAILKSLLFAYALTGVALLLLALVLFAFDLGETAVDAGIIIIYVLACFMGGFMAGKIVRKDKYLWGVITGLAYYVLLLTVSVMAKGGWDIGGAVAAWCRSDRLPPHAPSQIVSYVSAHDNFTLWDKLLLVRYEKPEFTAADSTALAQNRLAAGIYLTSFGLPFLQAGEEFARTKKGKGNSYRSSPALNRLDWERAEKYHALVDYYRGLLALRARFPRLSSTDPHAPDALYFFSLEQPLVGWQLPAQWGDGAAWQALCVFYNSTEISKVVPLPVGRWQMLSDGISSSLWRGPARVYEHEAVLMPYSATIFGQI